MYTRKRILLAAAIGLIAGLPAIAADKLLSSSNRTVAIWRGDASPQPPSPPRMAMRNQQFDVPPVPEEDVPTPIAEDLHGSLTSPPGAASGDANLWSTSAACNDCAPCCQSLFTHRCFFYGDLLMLRATGDNVAHAILQNGTGFPNSPGTTPNGRVGVVDSKYTSGFRVGFGIALDGCTSVVANFTDFYSHATDSITANPNLGDTVASLVLHPNTINAGSTSTFIDAIQDVDFRIADVDYRQLLAGGCHGALNGSVGIRYGRLQQNFLQIGEFSQPVGTIQTTTGIKFEGAGLRGGLDYERQICASRCSAYGKGFLSVLFGQFNSQYTQLDTTSTIVQATSNWRDERVVPVLDYEVGLNWTSCSGAWRIGVGYYTAFWFNSITTSEYIQAVQNANFVNLGDTVVFDGLVTRLEYRF